MCGIVAIAGQFDVDQLHEINSSQIHRGPDSAGHYVSEDGAVGLAMRRLSIIDIESGSQPITNEDGSVVLICNGEIYNSPQLRPLLEGSGHRFRTRNSDVETIIHLYEERGVDCLQALNGMFSFILHDRRRNLLFGARDRIGIKPLYYFQSHGTIAFASELKSLLRLSNFSPSVNRQSLFHYMTMLYVPAAESILNEVMRIPPGHYFIYDLQRKDLSLHQYWSPTISPVRRSPEESTEVVRQGARDAVERWTLSDVPIACSLSGGLDSASIVGLLAESGQSNIKTYTLGFSGPGEVDWNETKLARLVAERWGTEHHEVILSPDGLLDELIDMVWALDEPYGGGLPSWYVFKLMSKDVKVAMTGTGGDELFGNYHKYRYYEASAPRRLAILMRWLARQNPRGPRLLLERLRALLLQGRKYPFGGVYPSHYKYFSDYDKRESLFMMPTNSLEDTGAFLQKIFDAANSENLRNGLAAVDFRTQLAEEFLHMTDRFSMAHSLEARVPLLDHEFVETVFSIDPMLRSTKAEMKYLFKRSMADLLPEPLLHARKRGFIIPIDLWLRTRLRPVALWLLSPERLKEQGFFAKDFAQRYLEPHLTGRRNFGPIIWAALMFQLWHLIFIEQRCVERPSFKIDDIVA
jgi:asparagine synthase (glutamine-hydrolysing)